MQEQSSATSLRNPGKQQEGVLDGAQNGSVAHTVDFLNRYWEIFSRG
jgi:hypothetical protein